MATAISLITKALRGIQVLGIDENASADMASNALDSLNDMLSTWSIERLMIYQLVLENFPFVLGQTDYTIGPTGNFNTSRPTTIQNAYVRFQGLDYPVGILTTLQYDNIALKTQPDQVPLYMLVDQGYPLSTLKFWPTPNTAAASIYLESTKEFTNFATLTTNINFPPGYQRAITRNLSVELAPEYGVPLSQVIVLQAESSKKWIKRINYEPIILDIDNAIPRGARIYDIYGDFY